MQENWQRRAASQFCSSCSPAATGLLLHPQMWKLNSQKYQTRLHGGNILRYPMVCRTCGRRSHILPTSTSRLEMLDADATPNHGPRRCPTSACTKENPSRAGARQKVPRAGMREFFGSADALCSSLCGGELHFQHGNTVVPLAHVRGLRGLHVPRVLLHSGQSLPMIVQQRG